MLGDRLLGAQSEEATHGLDRVSLRDQERAPHGFSGHIWVVELAWGFQVGRIYGRVPFLLGGQILSCHWTSVRGRHQSSILWSPQVKLGLPIIPLILPALKANPSGVKSCPQDKLAPKAPLPSLLWVCGKWAQTLRSPATCRPQPMSQPQHRWVQKGSSARDQASKLICKTAPSSSPIPSLKQTEQGVSRALKGERGAILQCVCLAHSLRCVSTDGAILCCPRPRAGK